MMYWNLSRNWLTHSWCKPYQRSWARLRRLTWTEGRRLLEAVVVLGLVRMAVILLPVRILLQWLHGLSSPLLEPRPNALDSAQRIGVDLDRLSHYTPWRSRCLEQAVAGKLMLHYRGVPSTLYLGVAKQDAGLIAHAWLCCGDQVITGARGRERFTVVLSCGAPNHEWNFWHFLQS